MLLSQSEVWVACALLVAGTRLGADGETKLAKRLAERDPKVLGPLFDAYGPTVYALISRIVGSSAAAEHLTQETFLRVWNRARNFDPEQCALGPWILTVARNRAVDYMRSSYGKSPVSAGLGWMEHPSRFCDFFPDAFSETRLQRMKDAFESLTTSQKTVLELAYYEGLSMPEITERLGQPPGTVQTWMLSALGKLRMESAGAKAE